ARGDEVAGAAVGIDHATAVRRGYRSQTTTGIMSKADCLAGRADDAAVAIEQVSSRGGDLFFDTAGGAQVIDCAVGRRQRVLGSVEYAAGRMIGTPGLQIIEAVAGHGQQAGSRIELVPHASIGIVRGSE